VFWKGVQNTPERSRESREKKKPERGKEKRKGWHGKEKSIRKSYLRDVAVPQTKDKRRGR